MGSFTEGMRLGQNAYQAMQDNEQRDKEFAIKQKKADQETAEYDYLSGRRSVVDSAWNDRVALERDGAVGTNTSGFTNGSAQMMYGQGGQKAVDDAASYANAELVRAGLQPKYQTSLPVDAGDGSPLPAATPTVGMRKATRRETNDADMKIALANRDLTAANGLRDKNQSMDWYAEHEKLPTPELAKVLGPLYNNNHAFDGNLTYDPKVGPGGSLMLTPYGGESKPIPVSRSDLLAKAYAVYQLGNGDIEKGLSTLATMDTKEQEAALARVTRNNTTQTALATHGLNQFKAESEDTNRKGMLGVHQQNANTQESYRRDMAAAAATKAGGSGSGSGSGSRSGSVTERLDAREREAANTQAAKAVAEAQKTYLEALQDPKNAPLMDYAKQGLAAAKRDQMATLYRTGRTPPDQAVSQLLVSSKSKQDVFAGLKDLGMLAGNDYADEIAALINDHEGFRALPQGGGGAAAPAAKGDPLRDKLSQNKPALGQGMRGSSERNIPMITQPADPYRLGGAVGEAIRAKSVRGAGTTYEYRGEKYPTRAAAEAAKAANVKG